MAGRSVELSVAGAAAEDDAEGADDDDIEAVDEDDNAGKEGCTSAYFMAEQ